jgi:hypothetical protein
MGACRRCGGLYTKLQRVQRVAGRAARRIACLFRVQGWGQSRSAVEEGGEGYPTNQTRSPVLAAGGPPGKGDSHVARVITQRDIGNKLSVTAVES